MKYIYNLKLGFKALDPIQSFSVYRVYKVVIQVSFSVYRVYKVGIQVSFSVYRVYKVGIQVSFSVYRVYKVIKQVSFNAVSSVRSVLRTKKISRLRRFDAG